MPASLIPEKYRTKWSQSRDILTARQIEKYLTKTETSFPDDALRGRVAFIGSFTLAAISSAFNATSLERGIATETFTGQYNQYAQEMISPDSDLYGFSPELTYLLLDARSLLGTYYDSLGLKQELIERIESQLALLRSCVESFCKHNSGILVLHTLAVPVWDPWGIHGQDEGGLSWSVAKLNEGICELASGFPAVVTLDTNIVQSRVGADSFLDDRMRHLGKFNIADQAAVDIADEQMRFYLSLKGLTRKCIVLDLDNTLWGGIVGEDGPAGIALGDTAPGSAYKEFQRTLLAYFDKGIILAVNSRNNWDDAMEVLEKHPDQILRPNHFGAVRINWNDKASNLISIAKELNIGLDSLVFFDDDHTNRELVRQRLPQVFVPTLPLDPSFYSQTLLRINQFDSLSFTEEDRQRGQMYVAERNRRETLDQTANMDEFLATLDTKVSVAKADTFNIPRVSQLTQRTNQFNMTTRRYSEADISAFADAADKCVYTLKVSDRFGDSGLVGVAIVDCRKELWHIDSFLMSCRVLGRKIEHGFMWWIATQAQKASIASITGEILYTKKNPPARKLYSDMSFEETESSESGSFWRAATTDILKLKPSYLDFVESDTQDIDND